MSSVVGWESDLVKSVVMPLGAGVLLVSTGSVLSAGSVLH